ncbi:MAG: hydroxypyruvate isomerase [SAR324 cluster bacterium]|nr:hydroxypyruvate isomerase [SAR324 cluster bacterium]MCZ6844010.1 hydroxypyruvate isomerase [SAR324 cluster bacterium]
MPRFNANLTMLYNEVDFLERFAAAARDGFKGVEYLFPYPYEMNVLVEHLQAHNLNQVLHNLPAGDWAGGDRRSNALRPEQVGEFQDAVGQGIDYAKALGCKMLNCLVGNTPEDLPAQQVRTTLVENLRFAAEAMHTEGIQLLVEPLNHQDIPGFHLVHTQDTLDVLDEVNHPNIWLQYDIYHMQIMEGNLTHTIRENLPRIAHMQLADNPGRNEPGTGEINYSNLFRFIDETGYDGWIGCEYKPAGRTEDGLGWVKPYL